MAQYEVLRSGHQIKGKGTHLWLPGRLARRPFMEHQRLEYEIDRIGGCWRCPSVEAAGCNEMAQVLVYACCINFPPVKGGHDQFEDDIHPADHSRRENDKGKPGKSFNARRPIKGARLYDLSRTNKSGIRAELVRRGRQLADQREQTKLIEGFRREMVGVGIGRP